MVDVMEDQGVCGDRDSGTGSADGQWHHVAVTWASLDGQTTLYLDDRKVLPCPAPAPPFPCPAQPCPALPCPVTVLHASDSSFPAMYQHGDQTVVDTSLSSLKVLILGAWNFGLC